MSDKTKVTYGPSVYTTFGGLVSSVVIVWLSAPAFMAIIFGGNLEKMGQAGDLFGSVNALFSGLAFAGLFWTVFLQRQQLAMQREELELQRTELQLQREEMAASRCELANQVRAQFALAKATAAQISVASHQAYIELLKLQYAEEGHHHTAYAQMIGQIKSRADTMQKLATSFDAITDARLDVRLD